jgi:hypothetical protein
MAEYDEDILPNLQSQYGKGFIEYSKLKKATDSNALFRDAVFIVNDPTSPYIGRHFQLPSIIYSGVPTADLEEAKKLWAQNDAAPAQQNPIRQWAQNDVAPVQARIPEKSPTALAGLLIPQVNPYQKFFEGEGSKRIPENELPKSPSQILIPERTPRYFEGTKIKNPIRQPSPILKWQSISLTPMAQEKAMKRTVQVRSSLSLTPNFNSQQAAFSLFGQKQRTVRKRGRLL